MKNNGKIFLSTLSSLESDENIKIMGKFSQHEGNTTLQHCENVAKESFYLAEKLGIKIDEKALARGAMLHDYYLYSTKDASVSAISHWFCHPKTALKNAEKKFELSEKEKNIIRSHMFPLTIFCFPRSKEAVLVSVADKYCALREFVSREGKINPQEKTHWIWKALKNTIRRPAPV